MKNLDIFGLPKLNLQFGNTRIVIDNLSQRITVCLPNLPGYDSLSVTYQGDPFKTGDPDPMAAATGYANGEDWVYLAEYCVLLVIIARLLGLEESTALRYVAIVNSDMGIARMPSHYPSIANAEQQAIWDIQRYLNGLGKSTSVKQIISSMPTGQKFKAAIAESLSEAKHLGAS